MPRDFKHYLTDMLQAIQQIEQSVTGIDLETFQGQYEKINSVLFNLMTLGEAAKNIPPEIREAHPMIPWSQVGRFRDFVVHHYWSLDIAKVWQIAHEDISPLKVALESLVKTLINPPTN